MKICVVSWFEGMCTVDNITGGDDTSPMSFVFFEKITCGRHWRRVIPCMICKLPQNTKHYDELMKGQTDPSPRLKSIIYTVPPTLLSIQPPRAPPIPSQFGTGKKGAVLEKAAVKGVTYCNIENTNLGLDNERR